MLMKSICLFWFVFLLVYSSYSVAQSSVYGKIYRVGSEKGVSGLSCKLSNSLNQYVTMTDSLGKYTFYKVISGMYDLDFTYDNRNYRITRIRLSEGEFRELTFDVFTDSTLPQLVIIQDPGPPVIQNGFGEGDYRVKYKGPPVDLSQGVQNGKVDFIGGKFRIKGSDRVKIYIDQSPVMAQPIIDKGW